MKLTLPQQDIYFEQLLYPDEPIYNIGAKIEIKGKLDFGILERAYTALIDQHDAYRSILIKEKEEVLVKLVNEHRSKLGFIDFSNRSNPIAEATNYIQNEFVKPFDLFTPTLLHVFTLIKVEEDFFYLFSVYHHIITDGWGTSLMFQRLVRNYNEIYEFNEIKTNYPYSYTEFCTDDDVYQHSELFVQDKNYWLQKFGTLPENAFDRLDSAGQFNKSSRKKLVIKRSIYNQLNQLATTCKCSCFHLILGILYAYIGRKYQKNDIVIGLPVLNRSKSVYKKTVGLFMGVSPLRISLDFNTTFLELFEGLKNQLRQDYRHQRFPLGKLIQELRLFKEKLFDITLSYEKQDYSTYFQNTQTRVIPLTHQSERVALAIYIREFDETEDVKMDFDYNLNYFDERTISQFVIHFENLIHSVLTDPTQKLKDLTYLTEKEQYQLLIDFNRTRIAYPHDKTILDLFQAQVEKVPEKIAVQDDFNSFSYFELNKRSNQIAEYLISITDVRDSTPIAVLLDRSPDILIILLGILKSGRSYIPLDPAFPKDRLNYIITNSQTNILFCEKKYARKDIGNGNITCLVVDDILGNRDMQGKSILPVIFPGSTAYIIYTSGSTGNPKGVEVGHQSLLNFVTSMQQKPGVDSGDMLFSLTTYSFDISILELVVPILSGATLYIANQIILSEPHLIIRKLEEIKPTLIQATPGFYQLLFDSNWQGDKKMKVLCGGDLLSEALAEKLLNHNGEVWNMYGPTETTIWSSTKKIERSKHASNIGKPINNTRFYILDQFLSLRPVDAPGAIYIGGDGLAKGYYKNEQLTKKNFIQNPFDNKSLMYATGDIGKWNSEGEIIFLGRNDNQVKIRGYRIELGEIESHLNQMEGIRDSVVIAKKGEQQESFLVAYFLKGEHVMDTEKIIDKLKTFLPFYMIPSFIIPLEKFPITFNRKIDRKALSERSIEQHSNEENFKPPLSYLERKLSECWQEALKRKIPVSINENFFAIGGHSLTAVTLTGLIARNLLLEVSFKTIFDHPTIELLAGYLQKRSPVQLSAIPLAEHKDFYELTPSQYNIWLASQRMNNSIAYNMFAAYRIDGVLNQDKITKAINRIIEKYEILRTNFVEINTIPYQKIHPHQDLNFTISTNELKGRTIDEGIHEFVGDEFNLETDLLIKVQLLKLEGDKFVLIFCTHHLIIDGLSLEIFIKEFVENYNENVSMIPSNAIKSNLQFKDYAEWLNKRIRINAIKNELFWTTYLKGYQPKHSFHWDLDARENHQNGAKYHLAVNPETTSDLRKLALEEQTTFYALLLTALSVLIHGFSHHNDICIGTVNSGRSSWELDGQIGMFAKTIILRTRISSKQTFVEVLKNTHNDLLKINDHQDIPLNVIPGSTFDILLTYIESGAVFECIRGLNDFKLEPYPADNKYSRLPIVFNLILTDNGLEGSVDYNCDLFEQVTIQVIVSKFEDLLTELVKKPLLKMESIESSWKSQKDTIVDFDFNF